MMTPELREHNTPEKRFYATIHGWLKKAMLQRIENTTSSGVPDVYVCLGERSVWLELKVGDSYTEVFLRKEQYAWGMRHASFGGVTLVVAFLPPEDIVYWRYPFSVEKRGKYLVPHIRTMHLIPHDRESFLRAVYFEVYGKDHPW